MHVAATETPRPLDFAARVAAVQQFQQLPEAAALAAAHKRVRNILAKDQAADAAVDTALLEDGAEAGLYAALQSCEAAAEQAGDYVGSLRALAALRAPVDTFFDQVMVMADEPKLRNNRLALLAELDRLCRSVADISCLPG